MKKRLFAVFSVLVLACSLPLSGTFAVSKKQFSDVPPSKYFSEAIYDLAERNIIGGYPDGTFKPGNTITRGQAASIIAKMVNLDTSNVKNPGFKDVSTANGYYKAIAAMVQEGIISGYGDGHFGPNDPIKRGQMASILVKAFDLPRYGFNGNDIPFKDVDPHSSSHSANISIIYKLGITGGTSPDKFSPNAFVTRGQVAKMLKATEEAKPMMATLEASDFGWDRIRSIKADEFNSAFFEGILVKGKYLPTGYTGDKVQLIPLQEGTSTLVIVGGKANKQVSKKYDVHIKKENGELQLVLETTAELSLLNEPLELSSEAVQNVSLAMMDGKKLSDNVKFEQCNYYAVCIDIDQLGQYIATVLFAGGEEVRYGIEAKTNTINTLKEQLSDIYEEAEVDIGKHKIVTENYEQIAEITRDTGTNLFRARLTGEKEGSINIEYEHRVETDFSVTDSLTVVVQRIGVIRNVEILANVYSTIND